MRVLYSLQGNMSFTFEQLPTRTYDLEIQISRHVSYFLSDPRDKKEAKKEFKKDTKPTRSKEAIVISTKPIKVSSQQAKPKPKIEEKF
jgi:hypothetical protein